MEPFTTGAIAIVTVIATKAVEKAGEMVAETLWNKTGEFLVTLKKHSPHTGVTLEKAPSQPLDYGKAVLGYLLLGLELVGWYVAKKPLNYKLAQMLQRLTVQRLENIALKRSSSGMQQSFSTAQLEVLAVFELSWQELRVATQLVVALLSLFALNIFAWVWVEYPCKLLNWSLVDVETANEQLYGLHLIQWVKDTSGEYRIRIHPLIREFLKAARGSC